MIKKLTFFIIMFIGIVFINAQISLAATLPIEVFFQNNTENIYPGNEFNIDLKISSSNKLINVVDGTILYDKNIIEVKKVNNENSIFSLWTKDPVYNNEIGELSFTGGSPTGFAGKNGQILTVTFKAKKSGTSLIGFKDIFSVFVADGKGTTINPWLMPMPFAVKEKISPLSRYSVQGKTLFFIGLFVLILIIGIIKMFNKFKHKYEK